MKLWFKLLFALLITLAISLALLSMYSKSLPSYWETQKAAHAKLDREHAVNAQQLEDEAEKTIVDAEKSRKVSSNSDLMNVLFPSANRGRDLVKFQEAYDSRIQNMDERIPQAIVDGSDTDWVSVTINQIPTHVTVAENDMITPPWRTDEKTNADGRPLDPIRHRYDKTVLMKEREDMNMAMKNVGNLDELIGRFCRDGLCTPGFPMGTDSVLCVGAGLYDGGDLQVWRNGLIVQDQVTMKADFAAGGKYNLKITPDDPPNGQMFATNVCRQNPGELVVQKPKLRVPSSVLVKSN